MKNFISLNPSDFEQGAVIEISNEDDGGWWKIMEYEKNNGNPQLDIIYAVEGVFNDDPNIIFDKRDRDLPLVVLRF